MINCHVQLKVSIISVAYGSQAGNYKQLIIFHQPDLSRQLLPVSPLVSATALLITFNKLVAKLLLMRMEKKLKLDARKCKDQKQRKNLTFSCVLLTNCSLSTSYLTSVLLLSPLPAKQVKTLHAVSSVQATVVNMQEENSHDDNISDDKIIKFKNKKKYA